MIWVWVWLGIICLAAVIEFATLQIVAFWFAIGGIFALITSVCPTPFWAAIIVFLGISLPCLFLLRKKTIRYLIAHNEAIALRKKAEADQKQKCVQAEKQEKKKKDNAKQ